MSLHKSGRTAMRGPLGMFLLIIGAGCGSPPTSPSGSSFSQGPWGVYGQWWGTLFVQEGAVATMRDSVKLLIRPAGALPSVKCLMKSADGSVDWHAVPFAPMHLGTDGMGFANGDFTEAFTSVVGADSGAPYPLPSSKWRGGYRDGFPFKVAFLVEWADSNHTGSANLDFVDDRNVPPFPE